MNRVFSTCNAGKFYTVFSLSILTLTVWLLVAPRGFAQPEDIPPDVLEVRPDGYVYADYPGVFDDVEGDGITVETWVYLTGRPKDGDYLIENFPPEGQWIIFAKPGSYSVSISGRDLGSRIHQTIPEGTALIRFSLSPQPTEHDAWGGGRLHAIAPDDYPFSRRVHIAMQIVARKHDVDRHSFYDRTKISKGGMRGAPMGRTSAPLMIGGATVVRFKEGSKWGYQYGSMEGYIDEFRISKGFRYGANNGGEIRPRRHFRADAQTLALWRFEEGPGAPFYRDSSRNGYTLFPGGSLAVHPRDKAATTWGSLKRGTF